LKFHI